MIKTTKWVILVVATIVIAYDVIVATNAARGDTISEVTLAWGHEWATLPFLWGMLLGHLFAPRNFRIDYKWERLGILWCLVIISMILDFFDWYDVYPLIPSGIGLVAGAFLWPQHYRERPGEPR